MVRAVDIRYGDTIRLDAVVAYYSEQQIKHDSIRAGGVERPIVKVASLIYTPTKNFYWARMGRPIALQTENGDIFMLPEWLEIERLHHE